MLAISAHSQEEPPPSADAALDAFTVRLQAANKAYRTARAKVEAGPAYQEAKASGDRAKTKELIAVVPKPDLVGISRDAISVADRLEGDEAVRLLSWAAIQSRDKETATEAVPAHRTKRPQEPGTDLPSRARRSTRP